MNSKRVQTVEKIRKTEQGMKEEFQKDIEVPKRRSD
jgi:hypothetical protein